jgi:hypothetical protein
VYWQVNGEFDLGDSSDFRGTIIANGAIHLLGRSSFSGRALSTAGAISLTTNIVTLPAIQTIPAITAGGPTIFCQGGTVVLSGNNGGTWSNGATTQSITVTAAGNYFVNYSTTCGNATSNHILVNTTICTSIPTMSEWGLLILAVVLIAVGGFYIMRRNRPSFPASS